MLPPVSAKGLPLTGSFACQLDDKRGLMLPELIRQVMGSVDTLFVTPGPDGSLWLATPEKLERTAGQRDWNIGGVEPRVARRLYLTLTEPAAVDQAGLVILPERTAPAFLPRSEVVLIAVGDHLELWDAPRWRQYEQQTMKALGMTGTKRCTGIVTTPVATGF